MIEGDREPPFEVPEDTIVHYLLNPDHPKGGPKARYFPGFGFDPSRPKQRAEALLAHHAATDLRMYRTEVAGRIRLICEGPILAPDGRFPTIRTVWQLCAGAVWRLVTAVPLTR